MKYPQLVSARAVSAISDWLVTQLEQLGVDSSLVYSRLLLSLLHTPLQINALDLAEISDIKIGNCNRKGSNRRFSAADTEAIKREAAIDSLLEAVSSDQQVSKIESLIDELSQKLRDIENQNHLDESVFIQNDDDLENMKENSSLEDPAKRYYRAFPALSKDITGTNFPTLSSTERSSAIKSLSWPTTASAQSTFKSSSGGVIIPNSITGIKKKPRRRRVNTTMTSASGPNTGSKATAPFSRVTANNNRGQSRKTTSCWDTDFDGAWEMGRDLIREFVMKQNNRNRSISESEACNFFELDDGIRNKEVMAADAGGLATGTLVEPSSNMDEDDNLMQVAAAATTSIFNQNIGYNQRLNININSADSGSFSASSNITDTSILMLGNVIRSEGYATPDTMSAFKEASGPPAPRRLYEREVSNESINAISANANGIPSSVTTNIDTNSDESNHLAAFKAKFNRNVEALWDDTNKDENQTLTNVDPNKQPSTGNDQSFWFNYYKHRYNGDEPPTNVSTGFVSMYPTGGSEKSQYQDLHALSSLPNIKSSNPEKHSNLNQVYDVTVSNTGGGMNLTASIWSDNIANNESDVSFYANAAASWEKTSTAKKTEQAFKMNFMNTEDNRNITADEYSTIGPSMETAICGYDKSNFSKWSDCTFETPFVPTIGREPSITTQQSNAEKIRKNMFENSYFSDFKSMQGITTYNPSSNTTGENSHALAMPKQSTSELFHLNENPVETVKVTLSNHSKDSGFKEVIPSHSLLKPIERYNSLNKLDKFSPSEQQFGEEENLLTSEKTHFRPIKQTYTDGYSFEISNELENIKYHRSASGTLYLDTEVYREYYLYDEDMGDHSGRIANNVRRYKFSENLGKSKAAFVLKYCVKQNEKSCQTEETEESQDYVLCTLNQSFGNNNQHLDRANSSLTNSTIDMESEMVCFNNSAVHRTQTFGQGNDKIQDDLIDKPYLLNIDGWTLAENRKRCQNNNNTHALWEHCAACTNDVVSLPANRLLKDELSADGDEIMSDLKYMQNLYIGGDWEDEDCETDEDSEGAMQPLETNPKVDTNVVVENNDGYNDDQANLIYSNVSKLISDLLQPERAKTFVQAISEKCNTSFGRDSNEIPVNVAQTTAAPGFNRIVSRNDNELLFSSGNNNNNNNNTNNNHVNYFGELWSNNNNVKSTPWKKEISDSTAGGNENIWSSFVPSDKADKGGNAKLPGSLLTLSSLSTKSLDNWEHSNLQKLWNRQSSDDGGTIADTIDTNDSVEMVNAPQNLCEINQPSTSRQIIEPAQSYSISNSNQQALQKYIDLANQKTETTQPADRPPLQQDCNISTANNINHRRTDRKRRHSATSQNILEQFNLALANYNSNDCRKLDTAEISVNDDADGDDIGPPANGVPSTTIITCKYWATDSLYLASALAIHGQQRSQNICHPHNGNATMTMHPTTILKHVAEMVTRPLTR